MKDKLIAWRVPHFIAAGGLTFGVEYATFLVAYYVFDMSGVWANTVSFALALTVNFLLNRLWVFRAGAIGGAWRKQTAQYLVLACVNYMITNIGLQIFISAGLPAFAVKLGFIVLIACWNFLLFQKYIFATKK